MTDNNLQELKAREMDLNEQFYKTCQAVLNINSELIALHDDIAHAGGSPEMILRQPEAVAAAKSVLEAHGATLRRIDHAKERQARAELAAKRRGRKVPGTFTLK